MIEILSHLAHLSELSYKNTWGKKKNSHKMIYHTLIVWKKSSKCFLSAKKTERSSKENRKSKWQNNHSSDIKHTESLNYPEWKQLN